MVPETMVLDEIPVGLLRTHRVDVAAARLVGGCLVVFRDGDLQEVG
ncbi:hypothetical protein [Frankia sp. Cppng1_Ct_nod]|nr:hypothetical protein [Frankia sp. Cppng1_Ct_nod]